jgi:protein-tyrosine phosphatase
VVDGATVPDAVLDQALEVAGEGGTVYVHCRGGRERSATVCAAVVVGAQKVSAADAIAQIQGANPVFKPLPWQVAGLEQWAQNQLR